jgi:hypothetical protein
LRHPSTGLIVKSVGWLLLQCFQFGLGLQVCCVRILPLTGELGIFFVEAPSALNLMRRPRARGREHADVDAPLLFE